MKKKILSAILAAAVLSAYTIVPAMAADTKESLKDDGSGSSDRFVEYDISEYQDNEMLVVYENGDMDLKTYDNKVKLAAGIIKAGMNDDAVIVQPNYEYEAMGITNDPYINYQWALENNGSSTLAQYLTENNKNKDRIVPKKDVDINVEEMWNEYPNGKKSEVVIALIDTGVQMSHPDLKKSSFWVNTDEIAGNGRDDDNNGYVDDVNGYNFYSKTGDFSQGTDNSHGTHNAGTILAERNNKTGVAGIAGNSAVKLMVLKTLGGAGATGKTKNIISAIKYAQDNGADICNLSIGTFSEDEALFNAMKNSTMLFTVSAGNYSTDCDETPSYPACYDIPNSISVANITAEGKLASTSNYGATTIDMAAPGNIILSTTIDSQYSFMSGTSMSAPMVAATAAMIYSYNPDFSLMDVKNIILKTVKPVSGISGKVITNGMLDAGAAMKKAATMPLLDVNESDSYYEAVKYLYQKGIMIGTSAAAFSPKQTLNRAMVITILGRAAGAVQKDTYDFSDVKNNSWYSGYVGWAASNGIVIGYGDGKFGPMDLVQAYQLDLMISRYAKTLGIDYSTGLSGTRFLSRGETAEVVYNFLKTIEA